MTVSWVITSSRTTGSPLSSWGSDTLSLAAEPSPRLEHHHGLKVVMALLVNYSISELFGKFLQASNLVSSVGCVSMC